ncbi:tumor necrosis factor receptor superfamily member 5 isoform X2 [Mauremys reevesii]|uniref:tumor necrosis factor receptor superfamily member 5 isoform X2 n=1 Tax=Mauremys reevesii TaxID=260615 RepID=UPI00193FC6BD|nr:tumor necrosis factor receptor superfamily member 5 isoform X2 [Mauremys reevesii]
MLPGCLLCLLGGCLLRHWASGSDLNCTPEQYQHDGRCCNRCKPGLKLRSDCTASQNSECVLCEERHFQSGWTKEKHCTPHKSCDHNAGLETRSRGDAKHNAECQCQQGMYCSSPDCQTCLNITACRPGEGVARKADNLSDTTCEPCKHGSFSNISSTSEPCRPWTRAWPQPLPSADLRYGHYYRLSRGAHCLLPVSERSPEAPREAGPGAAGSRGDCGAGAAPAASRGGVRGA